MAKIQIDTPDLTSILKLIHQYTPDTSVWAYGSRVKGTSTEKSDLDLVIFSEPEKNLLVSDLKEAFEESNIPFRIDLFIWNEIPTEFQNNIKECYVELIP